MKLLAGMTPAEIHRYTNTHKQESEVIRRLLDQAEALRKPSARPNLGFGEPLAQIGDVAQFLGGGVQQRHLLEQNKALLGQNQDDEASTLSAMLRHAQAARDPGAVDAGAPAAVAPAEPVQTSAPDPTADLELEPLVPKRKALTGSISAQLQAQKAALLGGP